MKYSVQVKVLKETKTLKNYVTLFDVTENSTSVDFKNIIKSSLINLDNFQEVKQVLYWGNKEIKDNEIVPQVSGLEYNLILK